MTPRSEASGAGARAEGSFRSLFLALAALPFVALSLTGLVVPAAERPDLTTATLLAESVGIVLAIAAIWAGDETTRRGRAGRRLGMGIVIVAVGLRLAQGALLG
jgi:hypothetical protein